MTISELICRLQAVKRKHGDLIVAVPHNKRIELTMSVRGSYLIVQIS